MGFEKGMCSTENSNVRKGRMFYEEGDKKNSENKRFSVLVVDDDLMARTFCELLLSLHNLKVRVVESGHKAVELHYIGDSFDLILMDMEMKMPINIMNSYQAIKELRDMGVYCAIVGVTSNIEKEEINNYMKVGLDDCISKPLTFKKIASFLPRKLPAGEGGNDEDEDEDDGCNTLSSSGSNNGNCF